jgi:hypothetical protein
MEYGYAKSSIEHSSSQAAIVPLAGSLLICLQNPSQASADFRLVGGLPLARYPEGPKRRPEGGEWEPIKISHGI